MFVSSNSKNKFYSISLHQQRGDNGHQIEIAEKDHTQDHTTLKEFKEEVRINLTQRTFVLFKYFKMNVFTKQIVDGNFQLKTSRVYFIHKNKKGSTYLMHSEQFIITKKLSAKPPNNKFVWEFRLPALVCSRMLLSIQTINPRQQQPSILMNFNLKHFLLWIFSVLGLPCLI